MIYEVEKYNSYSVILTVMRFINLLCNTFQAYINKPLKTVLHNIVAQQTMIYLHYLEFFCPTPTSPLTFPEG